MRMQREVFNAMRVHDQRKPLPLSCVAEGWWRPPCPLAQRESFDVIGVVGFGKDMGASRNIFDPSASDTFRLMGEQLSEAIRRVLNPLRKYMTFLPVRHLCLFNSHSLF